MPSIRLFRRFKIPAFASPAEERQHRKERLAGGFRIFASLGFSEGVAGHITARDPEFTDTFWVNPFGMNFAHIRASDLIRVDSEGNVVEGDSPVNVTAFAIHGAIHAARPEVVAAAHTHSIYGKAGRPSAACSIRSRRTPAPSSRTTCFSTTRAFWLPK